MNVARAVTRRYLFKVDRLQIILVAKNIYMYIYIHYICSIRVQIHGWRHGKLVRCFAQHGARFWMCLWDYFGLSKSKPRKNFRMSYLQRGKMEKQRRKEYLTTWECLYNKSTGRKLHESWSCVIASRDLLICKMFSPLFCFEQVKTLKNFSRKLFTSKIKEKRRSRDEE